MVVVVVVVTTVCPMTVVVTTVCPMTVNIARMSLHCVASTKRLVTDGTLELHFLSVNTV